MASNSSEGVRLDMAHPMAPPPFPPSCSKPNGVRSDSPKPKPATFNPDFYIFAGRLVGHSSPTRPPTPTPSRAPQPTTLSREGQPGEVLDAAGREREDRVEPGCSIDGRDGKEGGEAGGVENGSRGGGWGLNVPLIYPQKYRNRD